MKMSLQLKPAQRQQLAMTPQLQQAIHLLQLSNLELRQEIQQAIESNPMLEEEIAGSGPAAEFSARGDFPDLESRDGPEDSLREHLLWQLNLASMPERQRAIGLAIIDAIDSDGMLTEDLEAIGAQLQAEPAEVRAALQHVQGFDPAGIGYRDLGECLLIQLAHYKAQLSAESAAAGSSLGIKEAVIADAEAIIRQHLPLLGSRDYARLLRLSGLKKTRLQRALDLIGSLNPRPGSAVARDDTAYIVPDLIVSRAEQPDSAWQVQLNPHAAPRLRVNSDYAALVRRADNGPDNNFLRQHLQDARYFIKGLQNRNDTLMKVAGRIVQHQSAFLERGEEAMKPLVLHEIADAVGAHESTVSRATNGKYMHTPRGMFELKYFFSSQVGDGGHSSTAVRAIIRRLIADEDRGIPLSDARLARLLEQRGIRAARRTVAKYRESLAIPPSNERKRLSCKHPT